jgi:hypothetical protein
MKTTLDNRSAILGSIRLGKRIQEEFPEVAELYQSKNLGQIIEKLGLLQHFELESLSYVKNALSLAIRGYNGTINTNLPRFQGLITDPTKLEELARKHNSESSQKLRKDKKGMFGLSEKEKSKLCSVAGKAGGKEAKKLNLGIHGRNSKQKYEDGCLGAMACGFTPWVKTGNMLPNGIIVEISEKDFCYWLSKQPEYRSGKRTLNQKIAETVNKVYHGGVCIRNSNAIHCQIQIRKGNK